MILKDRARDKDRKRKVNRKRYMRHNQRSGPTARERDRYRDIQGYTRDNEKYIV